MGADLDKYQRPDLERLRLMIATLLRVPPEFVIVSGIEPSNSLLITIMVLEDDALRMSNLPPASLTVLSEMFVNSVMVNEKMILISGITKLFYTKSCLLYFIFKNRHNCFFSSKYHILLF